MTSLLNISSHCLQNPTYTLEYSIDSPCLSPARLPTSRWLHTPYVPTTIMLDAAAGICLEPRTGCPMGSNPSFKNQINGPLMKSSLSTQAELTSTLLCTAAVAN